MNNNEWVDYYEILEVSFDADAKTIKSKYRELTKKYHPDVSKEPDAEEKIKIINEAYETLGNEEKRKQYDNTYEDYKNGKFNQVNDTPDDTVQDTNVNYEDVKQNYTEEEAYYAKVMAIQQIIEEELEKTNIIIDSKNELILNGAYKRISAAKYYLSLKDLLDVSNDFINSLNDLIVEAEKYELLSEMEVLNNTITFLEDTLSNIPKSTIEAEFFLKKETYKDNALDQFEELKLLVKDAEEKLDDVLIYTNKKQISRLNYKVIKQEILNEANDVRSQFQGLTKILKTYELNDEYNEAIDLLAHLNAKIELFPKSYNVAVKAGNFTQLKQKIENCTNKADGLLLHFVKISDIFEKHYFSKKHTQLYDYWMNLYEETIKEINDLQNKIPNIEGYSNPKANIKPFVTEAIKLFVENNRINRKVSKNFKEVLKQYKEETISELTKSVYATWDKGKALEQLLEAEELIKTYTYIKNMSEKDQSIDELLNYLVSKIDTLNAAKDLLEDKYEYAKINKQRPAKFKKKKANQTKNSNHQYTYQYPKTKVYNTSPYNGHQTQGLDEAIKNAKRKIRLKIGGSIACFAGVLGFATISLFAQNLELYQIGGMLATGAASATLGVFSKRDFEELNDLKIKKYTNF